ncbi:MAG TPA: cadherin-like domain-containing protein, partial [Gemmataceae bacterium]|nr:cadherin-like domain-containing protein [Gemmataceae bacterium]
TPPLAAGDYTFLIQQLGSATTYRFDFNTSDAPAPDLTIAKTHVGDFTQGDADDTYTINVTNDGNATTSGTVTVTDVLPAGLTATAANSGVVNGWNLSFNGQTVTATRNDVLAASASYPPLTVTVDVAANAPGGVVNTATVAGGGETNTANNSDDDPTTILPDTTPNEPPVNTLPAAFATSEDVSVALAGISMTDSDAGNGTEKVTFTVGSGSLTVNTSVTGGVTAGQVTGNGTGTVVLTARPAAINATLAAATGLVFAPAQDQNGDVTLVMTTDDQGHTGPEGPLTDQDSATITVAPVNDPPVISTNAGLLLDRGATAPIGSALLAATDVDNTPTQLTFTITTGSTHGAVLLNGTPTTTFTQADVNAGLVAYQHDNSPGTADSFAFTVSDGALSAGPATFAVTITKVPAVTANPTPLTAFAGTFVTFTAAADGSPPPTVRWQVSTDGGATFTDVPGATAAALTFRVDPAQNGHLFRAVFTNIAGSATTAAAPLTVTPGLTIVTDPVSQTAVVGTTVTFAAAATGTTRPRVRWQVSTDAGATFANIPGAIGLRLRVRAMARVDDNLYRAVFTNAAGSAATTAAGLNVDYSVTVAGLRKTLAVAAGTPVSLTGTLRGLIAPAVQWEVSIDRGRTYTAIAGATSATYAFTAAAADTGKFFRATFTENGRTRRTAPVVLIVGAPPGVATAPADVSVAAGMTATFSVAVTGTPVVKVQWQVSTDGGKTFTKVPFATRTTLTLLRVKATMSGQVYRAMLTNAFDQVATPTATLTVT